MQFSLPKAYKPKEVDSKWYSFWLDQQYFKVQPESDKPAYCIVIPPPNVTGALHMGHALVNTLQDILIRWKRMSGYEALWVPGTDHAGIATQTVVEQHLRKTTGKRRRDYAREDFLDEVWKWKEVYEERILGQLKRLGCSCDWSRLRFTMDEGCNKAVRTVFKKLYEDGLIYRGDYLVNWDPVTQTALSDDEVQYEERESFLWHFKYPLTDGSGHIEIATTRPETMLGDTAVAVNPNDQRYQDLIGKTVELPLMEREIPIIADPYVDPEFGTGAVKITPAHDPNDYEMGQRHDLRFVNMMTPDGRVNEEGGPFSGLSMKDARAAVVKAMEERELLSRIDPHTLRVGISYRSKAVIEPFLSKQWFVRMTQGIDRNLRSAVEEERVRIVPKLWENTYYHWIDNLRDWCISRQLWWGHRIPIWYRKDDPETMICWDGEGEPPEVQAEPDAWQQDPDVLDTWFSSSLWPFSTLGWPDETNELQRFYPNSVLVTGHDILFFWVARMIMMGEYVQDKAPFPETFLHGLIYGKSYWRQDDEGHITYVSPEEQKAFDLGQALPKDVHSKWEKMSKSKGNIIDPLEVIDEYGTDAVRMALCAGATHQPQIDLDRRRFEEFKNFSNKIWNGARFVFLNLEGNEEEGTAALTSESFATGIDRNLLRLEDRWILSRLNHMIEKVNTHLEGYAFDQAATEAYDFFWKELCAYYLEIAKPTLFAKEGTPADRLNKQKILVVVLCSAIRLLHPMAPFITEELFQLLKKRLPFSGAEETCSDPYVKEAIQALQAPSIVVSPYPQLLKSEDLDPEVENTFSLVDRVIYTIRNIRGEMQLNPGARTDVYVLGQAEDAEFQAVALNQSIIKALVKVNTLECTEKAPALTFSSTGIVGKLKVVIPMPDELVDKERARLAKAQEKLEQNLLKLKNKLSNQAFIDKAPKELVEQQQKLYQQTEKELEELKAKLASFQ